LVHIIQVNGFLKLGLKALEKVEIKYSEVPKVHVVC
jgi:hypothetical protein